MEGQASHFEWRGRDTVKWATFAVTRGGPNSTAACAATAAAVPGGGSLVSLES
jgi:hypothetical protein